MSLSLDFEEFALQKLQNEEKTPENRDLQPEKTVIEKAKFEKALRYKCQLCDNTNVYFDEIDELKEHINAIHRTIKLVHEKEEKRFKCSLCESKFPRSNDLRSHISSVHEGIEAVSTGKSLSEALIFVSTNRQYDNRLFIELHVKYTKIPRSNLGRTCCVQKLFLTFRTIFVHNISSPCSAKKGSF